MRTERFARLLTVTYSFGVLIITINITLVQNSLFLISVIPEGARGRNRVDEANYLVKLIVKNCTENGASLI